jgi:hypothetical protein
MAKGPSSATVPARIQSDSESAYRARAYAANSAQSSLVSASIQRRNPGVNDVQTNPSMLFVSELTK